MIKRSAKYNDNALGIWNLYEKIENLSKDMLLSYSISIPSS